MNDFNDFIIMNQVNIYIFLILILLVVVIYSISVLIKSNKKMLLKDCNFIEYNFKNNDNNDENNDQYKNIEFYKNTDNYHYYKLYNIDNKLIGTSKKYKGKSSCINNLLCLKRNLYKDYIDNTYNRYTLPFGKVSIVIVKDRNLKFSFQLLTFSKGILFESIKYENKDECMKDLEDLREEKIIAKF